MFPNKQPRLLDRSGSTNQIYESIVCYSSQTGRILLHHGWSAKWTVSAHQCLNSHLHSSLPLSLLIWLKHFVQQNSSLNIGQTLKHSLETHQIQISIIVFLYFYVSACNNGASISSSNFLVYIFQYNCCPTFCLDSIIITCIRRSTRCFLYIHLLDYIIYRRMNIVFFIIYTRWSCFTSSCYIAECSSVHPCTIVQNIKFNFFVKARGL